MSDRPKVALVTGGGSGIGRATALALAADGARVMVSDLDARTAAASAEQITAAGGVAEFVTADVRSREQVRALVAAAVDRLGGLDIAFNNAGVGAPPRSIAETSEGELGALLEVNLVGVWNCMAEELGPMASGGGGVIINTASATALQAAPGIAAYAASKAAVVHLSRTAAVEYAPMGIRVHALCPGPIRTPMLERLPAERLEALAAEVPAGRLGEAEEVAETVVWLCSPRATYLTGVALPIDGGESAA